MLSQTLAAGLESYQIGPKPRALRLKKNLGLEQLGEHTGMSSSMLSKIERGQLFPTLPTLFKIAMVFGVGLAHSFVDLKEPADSRRRQKKGPFAPAGPSGRRETSFFFAILNNGIFNVVFRRSPRSHEILSLTVSMMAGFNPALVCSRGDR